jgi:hypothetical protein
VLVRADLPPEQQTVQACHAVAEAVHHFHALADSHPHLVICAAPDEKTLLKASRDLKRRGIRTRVFVEPDLAGAATALAAEPIDGPARRAFRRYPLLRFDRPSSREPRRDALPRRDGARPSPEGDEVMTPNTSRFGCHPCAYDVFL